MLTTAPPCPPLLFIFFWSPEEKHYWNPEPDHGNNRWCLVLRVCSRTNPHTHTQRPLRPWCHSWHTELTKACIAAVILLVYSLHHGGLERATDALPQRWMCLLWNYDLFQYLAEIRGHCLATPLMDFVRAPLWCLTCPSEEGGGGMMCVCIQIPVGGFNGLVNFTHKETHKNSHSE